ncbi:MAG: tetratricopeptide repeat protein [Flavobacteriales bacterium]|nr:tetratricopeptide repeat protein [Flavobacteriales bacterium]
MSDKIIIIAFAALLASCSGSKELSSNSKGGHVESEAFQRAFFEAQGQKAIGNAEKSYALFQEAQQISPENDAVYYELALYEFQNKNAPLAQTHIDKALELDGSNYWYHLLRANVELELGNLNAAEKAFAKCSELNPDDVQTYFELASVLLYQEKYDEAIKVYDRLEKRIGISEELSFQKQQLYLQQGKTDAAMAEMERLIAEYPQEIRYLAMLAQFYMESGNTDAALQTFDRMRAIDPDSGILHLQLSEYYAAKGEDDKSYEAMKKAFESPEVMIDQKINVLLKFYSISEFNPLMLTRAYELLEITEKVHPDEAKSYAMYGDFLLAEGKFVEARDKYRESVKHDQSRNMIWSQLLALEAQLRDWDALETEAAEAITLFPVQPDLYLYLGMAQGENDKFDDAIETLVSGRNLVIENPSLTSQFYSLEGDVYHRAGEHQLSDQSYDESLALEPNNVFVLNNYAYYLSIRKDNLPKAAEMAKKANELQPGQPSFQDTYGWVLFQQGKYEEALGWIKRAVDTTPNTSGEVLEHYGDVLFKLNRIEEAVYFWQRASDTGQGSEMLMKKLEDQQFYE